ncbi:hypothetical protein LEP3755_62970 (plasmid) [Leptolyngbya sp. NIES-3755]|nr:hypothetical protein LEP3755_62970 [Leptolyngbya sp. NIES-3755]
MPNRRENVTRKAKTEGWKSRKRRAKGGGQEYAFSSLPSETQTALMPEGTDQQSVSLPEIQSLFSTSKQGDSAQDAALNGILSFTRNAKDYFRRLQPREDNLNRATQKEQRIDAWIQILYIHELWTEFTQFSNAVASEVEFCRTYNLQQIPFPDWVYTVVPTMSRATLHRKQKLRRSAKRIAALAGNYGNRKGTGRIDRDAELQDAIETCIAAGSGQWKPSHIYEILQEEFGYEPEDFSIAQLRAWMRKFRAENPQKYAMYKDANRAKGTVFPAFGSRSQGIVRPNQIWEIDSFRTDVLLHCQNRLAGTVTVKRYSMIGCLDIFTRRAILLVSEYSKAEAVCQLLSMAILKWGIPEEVRSDRGKEYLSRRVKRFLKNLNIKLSPCKPRQSQQKPFIERFGRTFQHRDIQKLPSFVGHQVIDLQALRSHPDWNERAIELAIEVDEFQAWCNVAIAAYEQRSHGRPGIGLEGKTPLEVLQSAIDHGWKKREIRDPRELDFLMLEAPGKDGTRLVGRQGISVRGRLYVAPELATWIGKGVYVCISSDRNWIHVYQAADFEQFIGKAVWRHGENVNLAQIARQAKVAFEAIQQYVNRTRRKGTALLRKIAEDPIAVLGDVKEVLPQVESQLHTYPALQSMLNAISAESPKQMTQPAFSPEAYEAELLRLEAQEAQKAMQQQQAIITHCAIEDLFEQWQQGDSISATVAEGREAAIQALATPAGAAFLSAITATEIEERKFRAWLHEQLLPAIVVIDHDKLLVQVFDAWKTGTIASVEDIDQVVHYLSLAAGEGALLGLADSPDEQHQFSVWLKHQGQG